MNLKTLIIHHSIFQLLLVKYYKDKEYDFVELCVVVIISDCYSTIIVL